MASIAQKPIDGVAIDRKKQEVLLIEFKRTSDEQINFITCSQSVNEVKWNKSLLKVTANSKRELDQVRKRLMTVLLHEHEHVFQSYLAPRFQLDKSETTRENGRCLEQVVGE